MVTLFIVLHYYKTISINILPCNKVTLCNVITSNIVIYCFLNSKLFDLFILIKFFITPDVCNIYYKYYLITILQKTNITIFKVS